MIATLQALKMEKGARSQGMQVNTRTVISETGKGKKMDSPLEHQVEHRPADLDFFCPVHFWTSDFQR